MGSVLKTALGGATGLLGGAFANQKEGGTDTGNVYGDLINKMGGIGGVSDKMSQSLSSMGTYTGDPTKELQNDAVLGDTFKQGGTLDRTRGEEQNLASRGFSLQPEDHEAYGQASGDIARQFGQSEQSLAQALSDRGLSSSGVAGAAFTGAQGNKQEQLAGLQRKIANDRMNMNMQRLGQTRSFLSSLQNQGMQGENQMQQLGRQKAGDNNSLQQNKYNMLGGLLGSYQSGKDTNLQQQQQTQHGSTLSNAFNGMAQGVSGSYGGMSGGGGQKQGQQAGDSSDMSMFA